MQLYLPLGLYRITYLFSTQLVKGEFLSPISYSQDVIMFLSNQEKTKEVMWGHGLLITVPQGFNKQQENEIPGQTLRLPNVLEQYWGQKL